MTRSQGSVLSAMVLALVGLAGTAHGQSEAEPNNSIAQANVLTSANTSVSGAFASPSGDLDYFVFTVTETSNVSIRVWGPTPGVCPSGGLFDPVVTLFNGSGQLVAQNDDAQTLCSRLDATTVPLMGSLPAGTYYVEARNLGGSATSLPYTMVVTAGATPVPLTQSFTYQGTLGNAGAPVNGAVPMRFSLWTSATSQAAGSRVSLPIQYNSVDVIEGLFTVGLNFAIPNDSENFDGTERYLQIEIGDLNGSGAFTTLEPRQRLAPTPNANYALRAGAAGRATFADNATNAINAVSATFATNATNAINATNASSVQWIDIVGKPVDFADNDDGTGGWTEAPTTITTGLKVGIDAFPGSFDFAVNGTAAKTGGGSWAVFSDERLKHDIKPMAGTLDRLLQLRGYTYEYNADAIESRLALPGTQIGLMAQEVERIFPDWVAKDEQGFRYVTERSTTALMVEALRDLRTEKDTQIDALKQHAATQSADNANLKARLETLEALLKVNPTQK
jgi:hypothetical protein